MASFSYPTPVQAHSVGLDDLAGLAVDDGIFAVRDGVNWVAESGATARTSLGLAIGTDVQAYSARLADLAGLAVTDGNFAVGDGANWVAEAGATARTSLALGTADTPQFASLGLGRAALTGDGDARIAGPQNKWLLSGRNFNNDGDINLFRINASDRIEAGAALELGPINLGTNYTSFSLVDAGINDGVEHCFDLAMNTTHIARVFGADADGSGLDSLGIRFGDGAILQAGKSIDDFFKLQAWDVDGAVGWDVLTITSANTPTAVLQATRAGLGRAVHATEPLATANAAWWVGRNAGNTADLYLARPNTADQLELGADLVAGPLLYPLDPGPSLLASVPVSSASAAGAEHSLTARIGFRDVLRLYGESDGAGGSQNLRVEARTASAETATVKRPLRLRHSSVVGGSVAAGIGTGMDFEARTANLNWEVAAAIDMVFTDIADTTEDADLVVSLMAAGAPVAEAFRVLSTGDVKPANGYQSSDGSAGVTAGPYTTITSITVRDGLVTALAGS